MKIIEKILKDQEDFKLEFPYLSKYSWLYIRTGTEQDISLFIQNLLLLPSAITLLGVNLIGYHMKPIYILVLGLLADAWYTYRWYKDALKRRERMESMRGKMDEYKELPDPEVIRKMLDEFDNKIEEITDKEVLRQKSIKQRERMECEAIARQYRKEIIPEFVSKF